MTILSTYINMFNWANVFNFTGESDDSDSHEESLLDGASIASDRNDNQEEGM